MRGSWFKRDLVLVAACALILCALMVPLALRLKFDYDEWLEFHAIWQVGAGHKPYADFYFARPPYDWLAWAPVMGLLPKKIESLVTMRLLCLGSAFLALTLWLHALLKLRSDASWKTCALAATALVVLQVPVIFTFAQFRPDHFVLAMTLLGLMLMEDPRPARWAAAGALFSTGLLLTPKLILIYGSAVFVYGYDEYKTDKNKAARCLVALAAGSAAAFVIINAVTMVCGIDLGPYFFGVIERHLVATAHSGYRFGLARMILLRTAYNPLWLLVFAGGTYASVAEFRAHGWRKNKFLLVTLIFALLQPLWVKYFYDQYLYTVLLVWSLPLALFLHRAGRWPSQLAQGALAVLLLAGVFHALPEFLNFRRDRLGMEEDVSIGDKILELAPEGRPVAMQPPRHPVFREDSTLFIDHSLTPGGGPVTEQLMRGSPIYGRSFSYEGYLEQLERRPPSVIWVNSMFSGPEYRRAIDQYLRVLHPKDYEARDVRGVSVLVRRATRP